MAKDQNNVEKNIAICYLFKDGDKSNQCILTTAKLVVTHRNRDHVFPMGTITGIEIERKKMLLPLLCGGIIVPLSFIGLMNFLMAPALSIFAILAGIILFYLGWTGNEVLSINASNQNCLFPFRYGTGGVRKFVIYTQRVIRKSSNLELLYYLVFSKADLDREDISSRLKKPNIDVEVYDFNQLIQLYEQDHFAGDELLVSFDPVKSGISLKYLPAFGKSNISVSWPGKIDIDDFQLMGGISDFYLKVNGTIIKEG